MRADEPWCEVREDVEATISDAMAVEYAIDAVTRLVGTPIPGTRVVGTRLVRTPIVGTCDMLHAIRGHLGSQEYVDLVVDGDDGDGRICYMGTYGMLHAIGGRHEYVNLVVVHDGGGDDGDGGDDGSRYQIGYYKDTRPVGRGWRGRGWKASGDMLEKRFVSYERALGKLLEAPPRRIEHSFYWEFIVTVYPEDLALKLKALMTLMGVRFVDLWLDLDTEDCHARMWVHHPTQSHSHFFLRTNHYTHEHFFDTPAECADACGAVACDHDLFLEMPVRVFDAHVCLWDADSDEARIAALKRFWDSSREEFVRKTWHPSRLLWCLPIDEVEGLGLRTLP